MVQFLYGPIVWKQWLLLTEAVQYVHWCHNGRADPGIPVDSIKPVLSGHCITRPTSCKRSCSYYTGAVVILIQTCKEMPLDLPSHLSFTKRWVARYERFACIYNAVIGWSVRELWLADLWEMRQCLITMTTGMSHIAIIVCHKTSTILSKTGISWLISYNHT